MSACFAATSSICRDRTSTLPMEPPRCAVCATAMPAANPRFMRVSSMRSVEYATCEADTALVTSRFVIRCGTITSNGTWYGTTPTQYPPSQVADPETAPCGPTQWESIPYSPIATERCSSVGRSVPGAAVTSDCVNT